MRKHSRPLPVAASDRVSDVLARDESLVEVFIRSAPHFARLRDPEARRVMGRLVTVAQAAHTAGLPAERLVRDLNDALGVASSESTASDAPEGGRGGAANVAGATATHPTRARVVELDVRDDLRMGREPFSKIMTAVGALADDEVLHLRATFEPSPLLPVLAKRGLTYETQSHAPDDWSVWFWRAAPPARAADSAEWLDVRGLEPPEPLMRTLAALDALPADRELVQVNARVPQFLLPVLAERGYSAEIDESQPDRVLVRIRRVR
jgi:uncharacterized protein DUF2249/uncharacterized protein DUF1858